MREYQDDYRACQSLTADSPVVITGWLRQCRVWLFPVGNSWHWMLEHQGRMKLEPISPGKAALVVQKMKDVRLVEQNCRKKARF